VVEATAAADHEFGVETGRLPRKAHARRNAPLAAGERGFAHAGGSVLIVAGDDEAGACNGVRSGAVTVLRRIEIKKVAVFLRQAAVPVVANAARDAQGRGYLELILGEQAGLVGAEITIGIALKVGCGREVLRRVRCYPVIEKGDKVGRGHIARTRAPVAQIQLRVRPSAAEAERMTSLGPDGRAGGLDAVLKHAGVFGLVFSVRADGKRRSDQAIERAGRRVKLIADGVVYGVAGKVTAEGGSDCRGRRVFLAGRPGLIVGGVHFLAENSDCLGDTQARS